jgi:hypothetical protein
MARAVRRVVAALVVALCVSGTSAPAVAQTDDDAAERAAAEIAAARERANQAAEDFFAAESRLELLQLEQERLQVEFVELADVVAELKRSVEFVAVGRFVASGASGIPILSDLREPTEQLHGDVLARVVAESGATTLDDYDAARELLRQKREAARAAFYQRLRGQFPVEVDAAALDLVAPPTSPTPPSVPGN